MTTLPFHYVDDGAGADLTVVFLHAFPLHLGMWSAQRAALEGRARCVAFDVRGLGHSAPTQAPYMLEHVVDDLFALLDRLSIDSALLCGLSMGGYVALRAVEREPERTRGLMLCNTQAGADSDATKLQRAQGIRDLLAHGVAAYAEGWLEKALAPGTHADHPELFANVRSMISQNDASGIAAALVALATRTDTSASLARIGVPTRVIAGARDVFVPEAVAQSMAAQIPGADLHVLPNAGHLSNLESPEAFNALLLEHVERVRSHARP